MVDKKGFTLVEIAVVIAVAAIILSSLVVSYSAIKRDVVVDNLVVLVRDFQGAMQRFLSIYGRFPTDLSDNGFVPNFLLNPYNYSEGFEFKHYLRDGCFIWNGSRICPCGEGNPAIVIRFYNDRALLESIIRKVNVCQYHIPEGENVTWVHIKLTP